MILLSLPFALLGGAMAALITYHELRRHLYPPRAWREALKTGLVAATVLALLSTTAAWLMSIATR
ncbi:MAG: hypothetical protein HPY69_18620 [Armatimonadetes bacterium]|nr:hypothetical protein [Armatimonadota bacterium]